MMGGIIGGRNTRAVFLGTAFGTANASSYSFLVFPFGVASTRRRIVVGWRCSHLTADLTIPNACTIGGVAATRDFTNPLATGSASFQFWSAIVPSGTSGTIIVTRSATMGFGALLAWALYDLPTGAVVDTLSVFANPATGGLDTQAGGLAVGFVQSAVATLFAWTGLVKEASGEATGTGTAAGIHISAATNAPKTTIAETLTVTADQAASCQLTAISYR